MDGSTDGGMERCAQEMGNRTTGYVSNLNKSTLGGGESDEGLTGSTLTLLWKIFTAQKELRWKSQ